MDILMAYSGSLLASGASNPAPTESLGPKTILGDVVKSLYNSFNDMFKQFGLSIPMVAIWLLGIVGILILWSIWNGIRNRKSFSLEDEEDAIRQGDGGMVVRVLRPEVGEDAA